MIVLNEKYFSYQNTELLYFRRDLRQDMKNISKKMQRERLEKYGLKHLNKEKLETREKLQEREMQEKRNLLNKVKLEDQEMLQE